jgi:hypothetical protein
MPPAHPADRRAPWWVEEDLTMRKSKHGKKEKLVVHRETLRNLQESHLEKADGAGQTDRTCDVSGCLECLPSFDNGCMPG